MKKFTLAVLALLAFTFIFSTVGCAEIENGVKIQYATITLDYTDVDGTAKTEDVVIKLYTNYAPKTIENFINLAKGGKYNGTNVNHIDGSWFTIGGYNVTDEALTDANTDLTAIDGEFYNNGLKGNKLSVKAGSVVMFRSFSDKNGSNYNTATDTFAICTGTSAPFTTSEYCVFGMIEDADDLDVLNEIAELRNVSAEEDETEYKRYYVGGVDKLADKYFVNGVFEEEKAHKDSIDVEDAEKMIAGGELYREAGYISTEDYDEFKEVAIKFINAISAKEAAYFYCVPKYSVTIKSVTISNKI